jgi:hypothetical protein
MPRYGKFRTTPVTKSLDTGEHLENKWTEQRLNERTLREFTMLAIAIALLFTLTGIVAVLAIADSAFKARRAYGQLMREAALMRAGFAVQVEAQELRVRRNADRIMPDRRSALQRLQPVPAFAAA